MRWLCRLAMECLLSGHSVKTHDSLKTIWTTPYIQSAYPKTRPTGPRTKHTLIMFQWIRDFFAGNASTNWRRKRASRGYHKKVRARERELQRTYNNEDVASRYFYFAPMGSEQQPTREEIRKIRGGRWRKGSIVTVIIDSAIGNKWCCLVLASGVHDTKLFEFCQAPVAKWLWKHRSPSEDQL
jgi:hypothetical protein